MTYYKLENIEKSFGNSKILENISFSLNKGDIISFVGKSGMLLDEPFSALDSITKHYMHSWFESVIKKRENTIIFITHDIKEALKLSDKIFVLSGKPAKIVYSLDINKSLIEDTDLFNKYYNEILEYIGDI